MKNKYYKLVLASAVLIAVQTVSLKAQTPLPCGTDEAMRKLYAEHPELIQQQIAFDNAMKPISDRKWVRSAKLRPVLSFLVSTVS